MDSPRNEPKARLLAGVALGVLMAAGSAAAQASPPSAPASTEAATTNATDVQEVVVTANKREERIHDVALSVSAVAGADLERRQELNIVDISKQVPGFSVQQQGPVLNRLIIRGENASGSGATVGVVVDDVPFSLAAGTANGAIVVADIDPYDLNRVEVLRGPQGTLYGAGAEGGLVKYVTNLPNLQNFEAGAETGFNSIDGGGTGGNGKGFINIPVGGVFALRASGYYEELPGWIDNPTRMIRDANDGRKYGGRVSVLYQPIPDLTIRATAFSQRSQFNTATGSVDVVGVPLGTTPTANQTDLVDGLSYRTILPEYARAALNNYYLNIAYDAHWATFTSITSYGEIKSSQDADLSGTPLAPGLSYAAYLGAAVYGQPIVVSNYELDKIDKYNQEFRISSDPGLSLFSHPVEAQGGVFLTREVASINQNYSAFSATNFDTALVPALGAAIAPAVYREVSGFGEADYHLSPKVDVSGGFRVTDISQDYHTQLTAGVLTGPASVAPTTHSHETATTFSVAPRWHITDDSLLYARVASGFRPGGPIGAISGEPADFPTSYRSDSTVNYEVGFRTYLFDHKVSVDVAGYYIDWQDIQILTTFKSSITGVTFTAVGNGGSAESHGIEWTLGWTPVHGLNIVDVGSYTQADLTKDAPGVGGLSGQALAFVPNVSNTLNVDYEFPLIQSYKGFVGASWTYTGREFTNFGTSPTLVNHFELPSYNTEDLRAGVENDHYTFEFFIRNLSNERALVGYSSLGSNPPGGTGSATIIQPRTFGMRIAAKY